MLADVLREYRHFIILSFLVFLGLVYATIHFHALYGRLRKVRGALEQELSQRLRAEDQLYKAKEAAEGASAYLTTIINTLADALLVTDNDGRIMRTNPALAQIFALGSAPCSAAHAARYSHSRSQSLWIALAGRMAR
jgi:PAS domain-containing protein